MANNVFQVKRTSTSGRTPNTTGSYATNSQYIAAGEFALNMADGILYTSNGSAVITVGSNLVNQRITNAINIDNDKNINWRTVNTSATVGMRQQSDDNFVFYSTNTSYGARAVYSIYANSDNSEFSFQVPVRFNANVTVISANGSQGSAGQYLTSNGSTVYWSSPGVASVNTAAQWNWTNIHTFSANVSFNGNGIGIVSNTGAVYLGGITDVNWRIGRNTGASTKWRYTNNSIDIITANSNLEGMTIGLINGNSYFETGYLGTFIASNVTIGNTSVNATINSTSFSGTANNATNLGGVAAASYQTTAGLAANVATLTANNTSFVGTVSAANVVSNAQLSANLGNYQTSAGLSANVATLSANNASFLGGTAAASYQLNSTLNANIAAYLPTYNGVVNASSFNAGATGTGTGGSVQNTTTMFVGNNTTNVSISASGLVVNGTAVIANNTGVWTTGTVNAASHTTGVTGTGTGGIVANTTVLFIGNNTINAAINTTALYIGGNVIANSTGANNAFNLGGTAAASYQLNSTLAGNVALLTSNNASFLGGVAAASYVNTSGAYTISGIHTYTANLVVNAAIIAGGNSGSAGQVLTSNGAGNVYWSTVTSGGVNTAASYTWTNVQIFTANVTVNGAIIAGGNSGTAGQLLASNGTGNVYWTDAPVSNAVYMKGGAATIGTLAAGGSNIFRVNANTLNYNTTISTGENAQATGPLAVASGVTLTVESGARVAIV